MMLKAIKEELVHHAPFTVLGAAAGVLFIYFAQGLSHSVSETIFYIFHPAHVFLSAYATGSMYQYRICTKFNHKCNPWVLLIVGLLGSIGIATISDSFIPYWGESILGMPHAEPHVGFVEAWWLVNPLALAGIALAYFFPATKFPHTGHVLLSTFASLFHMMMAVDGGLSFLMSFGIFFFLFLAVWLPCCLSDIVFPLLFIKKE